MQHQPPSTNLRTSAYREITTVSQDEFTACVDRCVARLLAPASTGDAITHTACAQLRGWLHGEASALDDGRPIDLPLFDATILGIEERVPVGRTATRTQLLRAARELAESIYADLVPRPAAAGT